MIISTNDSEMRKELEGLEKAIVNNGGWIHPNLEIKYKNETGLSVNMNGCCPPSDYLIKLAEGLLVPVDAVNISVKGNEFIIDPETKSLSSVQIEIVRHMVSIFNLTDKVRFHINEDPWIKFREAPELMYRLMRARTLKYDLDRKQRFMFGTDENTTFEGFVAKAFMSTRILGYKASPDKGNVRVLMPLIDYMNHDYRGSHFLMGGNSEGTKGVQLKNRQPFLGSRECYAFYGMRDGLDMFLKYGFYEMESPFVRSIPLEISIEGIGVIIVRSDLNADNRYDSSKQAMNQQVFMPSVESMKDGNIQLSHLFITMAPIPHVFRRTIFAIIKSFSGNGATQKYLIEQTKNVEEIIVTKNVEFYKCYINEVDNNTTAPSQLVEDIRQIAEFQLNKLYKYYFDDTFYQNVG